MFRRAVNISLELIRTHAMWESRGMSINWLANKFKSPLNWSENKKKKEMENLFLIFSDWFEEEQGNDEEIALPSICHRFATLFLFRGRCRSFSLATNVPRGSGRAALGYCYVIGILRVKSFPFIGNEPLPGVTARVTHTFAAAVANDNLRVYVAKSRIITSVLHHHHNQGTWTER